MTQELGINGFEKLAAELVQGKLNRAQELTRFAPAFEELSKNIPILSDRIALTISAVEQPLDPSTKHPDPFFELSLKVNALIAAKKDRELATLAKRCIEDPRLHDVIYHLLLRIDFTKPSGADFKEAFLALIELAEKVGDDKLFKTSGEVRFFAPSALGS